MMSMHDFMAAVGYMVVFAGGATLAFFLIGCCVQYCWQKYWDFDAFVRVCEEAKRQGVKLHRKTN